LTPHDTIEVSQPKLFQVCLLEGARYLELIFEIFIVGPGYPKVAMASGLVTSSEEPGFVAAEIREDQAKSLFYKDFTYKSLFPKDLAV
jgi:hypothetical protein